MATEPEKLLQRHEGNILALSEIVLLIAQHLSALEKRDLLDQLKGIVAGVEHQIEFNESNADYKSGFKWTLERLIDSVESHPH